MKLFNWLKPSAKFTKLRKDYEALDKELEILKDHLRTAEAGIVEGTTVWKTVMQEISDKDELIFQLTDRCRALEEEVAKWAGKDIDEGLDLLSAITKQAKH